MAERKDKELKSHLSQEPISRPLQTATSLLPFTCLALASSQSSCNRFFEKTIQTALCFLMPAFKMKLRQFE